MVNHGKIDVIQNGLWKCYVFDVEILILAEVEESQIVQFLDLKWLMIS